MVESIQPKDPLVGADFPTCKNADIEWYVRTPTNPPPVDPNAEMLLQLYNNENTHNRKSASTLNWIGMYAGIGVKPCLSARFNVWHTGQKRKGETVPTL